MQYWNTIANRTFLLSLVCLLNLLTPSFAQENSPYSRYGFGNLKRIENVANRGMGGVSIADNNPLIANPANPATFASLRLTSFQAAAEGVSINVQNDSLSNRTGGAGIEYLNLAFPVHKRAAISLGLIPQTRSKYSMAQVDSVPGISKVEYNYYGGGGMQKVYIGGAYAFNEFALGIMTGYTFGNVINTSEANYIDSLKILSSSVTSRTSVGGFFLQLGGLSTHTLKDELKLNFGATYCLSQSMTAKKDAFWKSFIGSVNDPEYEYGVDSVIEQKGKVVLPSQLGAGFMLSNGDYWRAGIDFTTSNWSQFRIFNQPDSTTRSWMLKAGGAFTPDVNAKADAWKRATYRIGAYTGQDIFRFNNTNMPVRGVTAGLGYPIRRTLNTIGQINLAFDMGKRGTTDNGLLSEGYTRFSIGITLNDKWFIPRKYE